MPLYFASKRYFLKEYLLTTILVNIIHSNIKTYNIIMLTL